MQIDRYRKGTALIQVQNQDGHACAGVQLFVEQETHQFLFGGVLSDLSCFSADELERYQRRLKEVFNIVRGENRDQHTGADVLAIDFSNSRQRMHLAKVQRELDRLNVPVEPGKRALPGVHVYVSGRTIGSCDQPDRHGMGTDDDEKAAQGVAGLYTLCFSHPSVRGIFWSGVSDREEGVGRGGLLRRDLSPKHAHKTLRKLINVFWHTRDHGETDARGQFRFRGFFGTYRIVVVSQGTIAAVEQLDLGQGHHQATISVLLGPGKSL